MTNIEQENQENPNNEEKNLPISEGKILIISDLHLADGSPTDDFGTDENTKDREDKLIQFINHYNPTKIYFNGDIYELWQVSMKKIKKAHQTILDFIKTDIRVVEIIGNHDYELGETKIVNITTNNNKKVLISHGYFNDPGMGTKITRFFCWILGKIEKWFLPFIDNFFAKKKFFNTPTQERVKRYAEKMFKKGYDIVICGHTHVHVCENIDGKIYANCGKCQEGSLEGVLLDIETGKVELVKNLT